MRCPNCGAENADTSKFCKMCGVPLPALRNGDTNNGTWQRDSYLDENYIPTAYIPSEEQPGTVLVNTPPLPPPEPYYNPPYRENYDSRQRDPYRKNNTLLLTALIAILTIILVICAFLVVKYSFLDRIWKDPRPSNEIAQSESNAPLDPPASSDKPAQQQTEQPADAAPAPITPYTTPAKGESIVHDHDIGQQDSGGQEEPAQPPEKEPEPEQENPQETTTDHYIIPDSNTRYLTESDLQGLSEWELKLARNEIYARHGRRFKDPALQEYFDAQSWYVGLYDPEDFDKNHSDELSALEKWNAEFILKYEKDHGMMT